MKISLPVILLLFFWAPCFGQYNYEYGEVTKKEVLMTSYEQDPDAPAVVLVHTRGNEITPMVNGHSCIYTVYKRIKILNEAGLDYANQEIAFWHSAKERVTKLKANTYNYDVDANTMVVTGLEKKDIFTEKVNEKYTIKKFAFPNVRVGSVLEYSYTYITSDFNLLTPWFFQEDIPTVYSRASADEVANYRYEPILRGFDFKIKAIQEGGKSHWLAEHVPAVRFEPFVANADNYRLRMDWKLVSFLVKSKSWVSMDGKTPKRKVEVFKVNSDYLYVATRLRKMPWFKSIFEKENKWNSALKPLLRSLPKDPHNQVEALIENIRSKVGWNGELGVFPDVDLSKVFEARKANGTTQNLLLIHGLRLLGYDAYPVFISTRKHGFPNPNLPNIYEFNHCIAQVKLPSDTLLLDMHDENYPIDLLPFKDLNRVGFAVDNGEQAWVNIHPPEPFSRVLSANIKITDEGILDGTLQYFSSGYAGVLERKELLERGLQDSVSYIKNHYLDGVIDYSLRKTSIESLDDINRPLVVKVDLEIQDNLSQIGDKMYLNPVLGEGVLQNWFKQDDRLTPIDFGHPFSFKLIFTYSLPSGYSVLSLPEALGKKTADGTATFMYKVANVGNTIQILSQVELKKGVYPAESYPALRTFFDEVVSKSQEQIVIQKK